MVDAFDALRILPLASAAAWWAVGIVPVARSRLASPFERSLIAFAFLIGTWAFLDWIFLGITNPVDADRAILVSNVRITVITFATFILLLATKWISRGHSRFDVLLVLPVLAFLVVMWTGLTSAADTTWWGLRLVRDPSRYALWAGQQVAYVGASIVLSVALYRERQNLSTPVRRRFFWTVGSLVLVLALWISTDIYNNLTQTAGVPWFSSLLVIPAAIILIAVGPLSSEDFGEMLRAVSAIQERVTAVYLFYRTGEPLVALASSRNLPIEAEQLEGLLSVVGNFVETSVPSSRGYPVTAMRYDGLGIVAVRGEFVIVAAVYDGPAYDALRSELRRTVRAFEERRWRELGTWEEATRVAESAADELSNFLHRPDRTMRPWLSKPPSGEAKPRETP